MARKEKPFLKIPFIGKKIYALLLVLGITFLIYANSLQNGFVIEDEIYISNWGLTQSLGNIPKMFAGDTAPTGNVGIYRPLRGVYYAFTYALFGGENPLPYHLLALIVHLSVTGLVFLVVQEFVNYTRGSARLVDAPAQRVSAVSRRTSLLISFSAGGRRDPAVLPLLVLSLPFIAALLFGLHPVHTEVVDYLTANFDAVAYIPFFASFYFFLKAGAKFPRYSRNFYLSLILANLAFYSFEMTLTLPLLLLLFDFCFNRKSFKLKNLGTLLKVHGPYFISAFVFLFIRVVVLHMTTRGEYLGGSFYLTMLTMVKSVIKYLTLLVYPADLSVNPTIAEGISSWVHPLARMDKILSQSILSPDILFGLAIIGSLLAAAFYFLKKHPIISFCIAWFFISILPVSYIIPQGPILQERYIYIASFGFILLVVYLLGYFYSKDFRKLKKVSSEAAGLIRPAVLTILIVSLLFYASRTFVRNKDWKDSFSVWSVLAAESPQDVIANFYTANIYAEKNMDDLAINYYNRTLAVEYKLHEAHFALGKIFLKQGNMDLAATKFYQTLSINPQFTPALEGLDLIAREATAQANQKQDLVWQSCRLGERFMFSCPVSWKILNKQSVTISRLENTKEKTEGLLLESPEGDFTVDITLDTPKEAQTIEDYLVKQTESFGTLVNQGLANFLNFDAAVVRVWGGKKEANKLEPIEQETSTAAEQATGKLEFFLFKSGNVIRILVFPTDNPVMMGKFERLVSSMRLIEPKIQEAP